MDAHEREILNAIADDAVRTIYEALLDAQAKARNRLFYARLRSDVVGPEVVAQCEKDLADAKARIRAWANANSEVTGVFAPDKDQGQIAQLAAQVAAAAEGAVKNR